MSADAARPSSLVADVQLMRRLVENHDWASTPFGPLAHWPASLKTIVNLVLDSTEPLVLWWGEQLRQIYNDAYAPRVDSGDGRIALGQPAAASWQHGWAAISSQVALVLDGQASRRYTDFLFRIERNGTLEDTYWNYSFTPVRDDAGAIRGVLLVSNETTGRVLSMRRHEILDVLRQELASVGTVDGLYAAAVRALACHPGQLGGVTLAPLEAALAAAAASPLQVCMTAQDVGVDADLAVIFTLSAAIARTAAYHLFLEQFTLLLANARHRVDSEALRQIVEAERDRLLLDAPVGAAVMVGEELVYRLVNSMYAMVSGRAAETMVGKPFVEVFPELRGAPVHEKFKDVYHAGRPFVSQPTLVQIHRHGGALDDRYFTYNLSPLRTLAGEVYGLMVIAVDITVQVDARAEVDKLNTELQAAARAKDEFLALLGHELRNPLAPIVTALELMRLRDRSTEREQVIIRRQVTHLTRLVDDLLDVSRITRGKVELRKEVVDVRDVLMRAVEMVTPLIAQKQQRLDVDIASLHWYGDPARLAQIVSNLLTNASRYSPSQATVVLRAGAVDDALDIEVSDNGAGFSAELRARIFEPFLQGERELHGSVGGLGIGLALVKNLSELHGGEVAAHSEGPGKGSVFTVRLPLTPGPAVSLPAAPAAPAHPFGNYQCILVVDDNIDAADTLAEVLRMVGYQVAVAYTAETALQKFAAEAVDLAILDIGLPGTSGYALADAMRSSGHHPGVRYVALTGFGQELDKERSAAAGFTAHLVKPLTPETLAMLLHRRAVDQ
ncbi:MAG TPA: ATP-binding protein [Telluria sp.]|jgi:PAS domain S-box-containing protein